MIPDFQIPRTKLVSAILDRPEPIVLVRASAGMGKSTLLHQIADRADVPVHSAGSQPIISAQRDLVLWDIPPSAECHGLPEMFVEGRKRLVVAARNGQAIPGLHRARAYGRIHEVDWTRLVFRAEEMVPQFGRAMARQIEKRTGGWPVLAALYARGVPDNEALQAFLVEEVLSALSAEELVALDELSSGRLLPADVEKTIAPFIRSDENGRPVLLPVLETVLTATHAAALTVRGGDVEEVDRLADAYLNYGRTTRAITILQRAGHYDRALDIFTEFKGFYYIYRYGTAEYDEVLAGFPESFCRQHETLVLALCIQALKRGDIGRARQLLNSFVGPVGANPKAMLANPAVHSLQMRAFRHLMVIYEDMPIDDAMIRLAFALVDEFPADAHLERGSFYNAVLEFYMRSRRFAEAEDVAKRAYEHYVVAEVPILCFYISLHRAIMRLMTGDVVKAAQFAAAAAAEIEAAPFESPGDTRLLALLRACIAFEEGQAGALIQFLDAEFDQFSHGEIWPTVFEFALQYGAQALCEQFSPFAAASFLERWRIYQMQSRQFQAMIDLLNIINLQNGNRWREAAERLSELDFRANRAFMQNATTELTRIEDRDEIAAAMTWLRHFVFDQPTRDGLIVQLQAMHDNQRLTGRQQTSLDVWMAYVHKRCRDLTKARRLLQKILEDAARLNAIAPLAGEKVFLNELVADRRIAQFLSTTAPSRQVLRRLSFIGVSPSALAGTAGLTRRETKVLLMIAEGASNKFIAHALGLSEATVKFHLSNVYRKLGCDKRREAIIAARSLGLVS